MWYGDATLLDNETMNKIIRERFPASKLPAELRQGLDPAAIVTVTIEEEDPVTDRLSLDEIFAARRPPFRTAEEIDSSVRAERDQWSD